MLCINYVVNRSEKENNKINKVLIITKYVIKVSSHLSVL